MLPTWETTLPSASGVITDVLTSGRLTQVAQGQMLPDDLDVNFRCPGCGAAINSSLGHLRTSQAIRCRECRGVIEIHKSAVTRTIQTIARGLLEAEQAWQDLLDRTTPQGHGSAAWIREFARRT